MIIIAEFKIYGYGYDRQFYVTSNRSFFGDELFSIMSTEKAENQKTFELGMQSFIRYAFRFVYSLKSTGKGRRKF